MGMITLSASIPFIRMQKPKTIVLENVPTGGKTLPEGSINLFYGFRESLDEMSMIREAADARQEYVAGVEVTVDVGNLESRNITPEDLPNTRFLNLNRMTKAMEMEVVRHWKQIVKNEDIDVSKWGDDYWKKLKFLQVHPQLIGKLREFDQFSHIEAFAYPFDNPKVQSMCRRVALFSDEHVVSIECKSFPEIKVELPPLGAKQTMSPKM